MSPLPAMALDFTNALILAPMVRCGTLPMRLLALKHGADLVYGPEEVDKKMIHWKRVENKFLGTIDYVHEKNGMVQYRIHPDEQSRLVFQLGTADPALALQAAKVVESDVAGFDLNCGCPKSFSLSGGMGAGLLSTPDKLIAILENLVQNLSVPVTCKIRLLENHMDTIALAKRIEATGVAALTIHARTKNEEYKTKAHWDMFKPLRDAVSIPLILNGDLWDSGDVSKVREMSGANSFMFARAPEANPSIFRNLRDSSLSALPVLDAIKEYVETGLRMDMPYQNIKYVVLQMFRSPNKSETGRLLLRSNSQMDIAKALEMESIFEEILEARKKRAKELEMEASGPLVSDNAAYDELLPKGYKAPRQRDLPREKMDILGTVESLLPAPKRERSPEDELARKRAALGEPDLDTGILEAEVERVSDEVVVVAS